MYDIVHINMLYFNVSSLIIITTFFITKHRTLYRMIWIHHELVFCIL
jgi:hypothetical protein